MIRRIGRAVNLNSGNRLSEVMRNKEVITAMWPLRPLLMVKQTASRLVWHSAIKSTPGIVELMVYECQISRVSWLNIVRQELSTSRLTTLMRSSGGVWYHTPSAGRP